MGSCTAGCVDEHTWQQVCLPVLRLLLQSGTSGRELACKPAARGNASTERQRLPDRHEPGHPAPSSSASSSCSGTSF